MEDWKKDFDSTREALLRAWGRIDQLLALKIPFDTQILLAQRDAAWLENRALKNKLKKLLRQIRNTGNA